MITIASPKNWDRTKHTKNQTVWINTEHQFASVAIDKYQDGRWELEATDRANIIVELEQYSSRDDARKEAVKWMRSNPHP